ncbi:MAG: triose-phosphate isomerase [Gammaproteobacteria bacterium]|nr:triose-phosphate isomerase [Gammaproteobacteria bacterium]
MRQPMVAGNWKLNGSRESVAALIAGISAGISAVSKSEVVVCPAFVHLADVQQAIGDSGIKLGAQNAADQESGAFTGEIATSMLQEFGCEYVILGHSERRNIYGEDDALVAKKFAAVQAAGLKPILCVGELLEEREAGATETVVATQLDAIINSAGVTALTNAVIAYEPVWAIGTGKTASPEQAQEVHAFIRQKLAVLDGSVAEKVQILYGGSMNAGNAADLLSMADIDGGLIGGASLQAESFLAICQAAG